MIQRVLLGCAVLTVAIALATAWSGTRTAIRCPTPQIAAEIEAAQAELDGAVRDMEQAWLGGSRYAAAKVAAVDPQEVERATQRQRAAFYRLQDAQDACTIR